MRGVIAGLVAILSGCYHPNAATDVPCAANGACPSGQSCDFGHSPPLCVAVAGDAHPGDLAADVAIDAPPCQTGVTCPATAPICDGQTSTCRGCVADAECGQVGACTEYDGQCIADGDTIYVATGGVDSDTCTSGAACATIEYALGQVSGTRRTIRIDDGQYPGTPGSPAANINVTGGRVVISGLRLDWAGGATLSASSNGFTNPQVVSIGSNTDVVLEGITVANGGTDGIRNSGALLLSHVDVEANHGRGVNTQPQNAAATHVWSSRIGDNNDDGIYATGTLEVLRCVVVHNAAGGIEAQKGAVAITSTIIANNGASNAPYGGIYAHSLNGIAPSLQFDTIANNAMRNAGNAASGLLTDTSAAVAIGSSILYDNLTGGDPAPPQVSSSANATYCLFSGMPGIGAGNLTGLPAFVDETGMNYHLGAGSSARGAADPNATVHFDVDGEPRPQGMFDIGADEIP